MPAPAPVILSSQIPSRKKSIHDYHKERKLLQKKFQYAHGKSARAQQVVQQLRHQVNTLQAEHEHINSKDEQNQQQLSELEDVVPKTRDNMKERISRGIKCLSKKIR